LLRYGILPCEKKITLRPSLALSYVGSVTAGHSSSGRQPDFAVLSKRRVLYIVKITCNRKATPLGELTALAQIS